MFGTESSPQGYPPPVQGQPLYAPQGYYVPQPPKKSHKVRNILIGVLVFFVIAAMAANMGGGSTKHTASADAGLNTPCLLYTSPSPRDGLLSRMPSSA